LGKPFKRPHCNHIWADLGEREAYTDQSGKFETHLSWHSCRICAGSDYDMFRGRPIGSWPREAQKCFHNYKPVLLSRYPFLYNVWQCRKCKRTKSVLKPPGQSVNAHRWYSYSIREAGEKYDQS
jgi:hypothetical protein